MWKMINPQYAAEKLIERECDGDFVAKGETMNMSIGALLYLEGIANGTSQVPALDDPRD